MFNYSFCFGGSILHLYLGGCDPNEKKKGGGGPMVVLIRVDTLLSVVKFLILKVRLVLTFSY